MHLLVVHVEAESDVVSARTQCFSTEENQFSNLSSKNIICCGSTVLWSNFVFSVGNSGSSVMGHI